MKLKTKQTGALKTIKYFKCNLFSVDKYNIFEGIDFVIRDEIVPAEEDPSAMDSFALSDSPPAMDNFEMSNSPSAIDNFGMSDNPPMMDSISLLDSPPAMDNFRMSDSPRGMMWSDGLSLVAAPMTFYNFGLLKFEEGSKKYFLQDRGNC